MEQEIIRDKILSYSDTSKQWGILYTSLNLVLYVFFSFLSYLYVMKVGLLVFYSLRPLDVEFMKALHEKVNIVPVLAKADTLTPSEVKKKKIKASLVMSNGSFQSSAVCHKNIFINSLLDGYTHYITGI